MAVEVRIRARMGDSFQSIGDMLRYMRVGFDSMLSGCKPDQPRAHARSSLFLALLLTISSCTRDLHGRLARDADSVKTMQGQMGITCSDGPAGPSIAVSAHNLKFANQ